MYYDEIYLLDLCILAYQLHAQTLIWPMDPYYEQMVPEKSESHLRNRRTKFKRALSEYLKLSRRNDDPERSTVISKLHGPGICQDVKSSGWGSENATLDPILANYQRIFPWAPSFTRPNAAREPWIEYNTPKVITTPIGVVNMVSYKSDAGYYSNKRDDEKVQVEVIHPSRPNSLKGPPAATDLLYCFEGGTGAIGESRKEEQQYPVWSMMGFVLARAKSVGYDVYIVFRGSRSGALRPKQSVVKESGNPDWVTDMDFFEVVEDNVISAYGSVCRGFRTSVKTMLPTIFGALQEVQKTKAEPPKTIYVTGHSLGAALASQFTSVVVCGDKYGPYGLGSAMPTPLKNWPWRSIQLVSYSAPVVGGHRFHDFFNLNVGSRRVWLDGDPVTQERRHFPVGVRYRISVREKRGSNPKAVLISQASHEPPEIRKAIILSKLAKGMTMDEVPAGSGALDDEDTPWFYPKHCDDMLVSLNKCRGSISLEKLFPDFVEYLGLYLTILQQTLAPTSEEPAEKLQKLIKEIKNLKSLKELSALSAVLLGRIWNEVTGIQTDKEFHDFIGLCLCLAGLSEGLAADAKLLKDGAFKDLLSERV
jgi:hypothetical protein